MPSRRPVQHRFVRTGEQIWPLEVNPRYSASIEVLERALGASFFDLHVQACQASTLTAALQPPSRAHFSGKLIFYARQSLVVPKSLDGLVEEWNQPNQPPHLADLPRLGDSFRRNQPLLTILADGDSLDDVQAELHHRATIVKKFVLNHSPSEF
jgi:predicted ATP-grasp superfamily ATP-dependent carboligase